MLLSLWNDFLVFVKNIEGENAIICSILSNAMPVELTEDSITVMCVNSGEQMYLETKRRDIEKHLLVFLKKRVGIKFIIDTKKKKEVRKSEGGGTLSIFEPQMADVITHTGLNNKYKFGNFAVSLSNQMAHSACIAVSHNPGTTYNPLFLYGGVGVGKTHLAQAVGRAILEKDPKKKIVFCPGDQFINELIESIREKSTSKFRKKYRHQDLLIIDDIQFIAGKNAIQEEFFHTFNTTVSSGGQIILTSDRPPGEIKGLEDRLRSRFSGGMIIDIQQPDFELKTAILLMKADERNLSIDIEAAKIISQSVEDIRALEGALLTISARIIGKKDVIDREAVEEYFQQKKTNVSKRITAADVIKVVCASYNVKVSLVKAAIRTDQIALPRQVIMYLLRTALLMKLEEIAYVMKRKDHTTVMHAVDKIERRMIQNPNFKDEVTRIRQEVGL